MEDSKVVSAVTLVFSLVAAGGAAAGAYIAFNAFKEAKRQADAAETQIAVAKDIEQRQLRAYVGPFHVGDKTGGFIPPEMATVIMTFRNFGQTPALKVSTDASMDMREYPLPPTADYSILPGAVAPANPLTIHPGENDFSSTMLKLHRPMTGDEFAKINDGKHWRIYV